MFTDAERAALELAEQGTRIADGAAVSPTRPGRMPRKYYDEDQLAHSCRTIAIINAFNRVNVMLQQPAGDYRPGQLG